MSAPLRTPVSTRFSDAGQISHMHMVLIGARFIFACGYVTCALRGNQVGGYLEESRVSVRNLGV